MDCRLFQVPFNLLPVQVKKEPRFFRGSLFLSFRRLPAVAFGQPYGKVSNQAGVTTVMRFACGASHWACHLSVSSLARFNAFANLPP